MNNNLLIYNNILNFNLKQEMNNVNDLLYNTQNLKVLQNNIDQIQQFKDKVQMQTNMASLALLRSYIMDEGCVGITLFRNLIRRFYPLNDNQILFYENDSVEKSKFRITNPNVLKRKGGVFSLNDNCYFVLPQTRYRQTYKPSKDLMSEITINEFREFIQQDVSLYRSVRNLVYSTNWCFYKVNHNINYLEKEEPSFDFAITENELQNNIFMKWDWDIVEYIASKKGSCDVLLNNPGFMAQMGIGDYEETIRSLQKIIKKYGLEEISQDVINYYIKMYQDMGIKLSSYLSIDKVFITMHQDELDWKVILQNPRIQWDWDLINLFLVKYKMMIPQIEWEETLKHPSYAMYMFLEQYLNDDLLQDIEKLYDI